jgi:hypothetical protein
MIEILRISSKEQQALLDIKLSQRADVALLTSPANPQSTVNQQLVHSLCTEDWKYFVNNFCWIQDPEAERPEDKDIPFLLYDYQERAGDAIVQAIREGRDLPIEKSRKMGLSWLVIAISVWGFAFQEWDILLGSQKAENVDMRGNIKSLLEKARFILEKVPTFLIPPLVRGVHDKSMVLIHPTSRATIAGESNNTNFGRSDRRKVIFFDEFTSWELTDRAAWQACSSTTKSRIPFSTPNTRGVNCYHYQIIQDFKKKNKPFLSLHWTLHPTFADNLYFDAYQKPLSPWYDREVERATSPQEVAQELDINYEASMGSNVFPNFDVTLNVDDQISYDPNLPLYIAWDFGLDQTALLWIQPNTRTRTINIIDEYVNDGTSKEGADIYHYLDIVESKEYKTAIHFGDPHSGGNRSLSARGESIATILRRSGIIFRSERTPISERVQAGRNILPQVRISSSCILTIEMFISWAMIKPKTGNTSSSVPIHNSFSHIGDAYTYFAFNYNQTKKLRQKSKRQYVPSISGIV